MTARWWNFAILVMGECSKCRAKRGPTSRPKAGARPRRRGRRSAPIVYARAKARAFHQGADALVLSIRAEARALHRLAWLGWRAGALPNWPVFVRRGEILPFAKG